ncbi:MAG: DMT family transporter [Treponema sp.]|nr:DMT family transporter [Treponema sp.]
MSFISKSRWFDTPVFAGQGAILLCAVLWSTSGLFIKLLNWHPAVIAGSRSFLAAIFLLVLRRKQDAPKKLLLLFASGFWYAATMILFVIANKLTFSANAIVLQYTAPVWACLLGWFFLKEKPHWEHWSALFFTGIGMFLVFAKGFANSFGGGSFLGDCLALVSGITFAASSVVLRGHKDGNPLDVMICAHIICVFFSLPFFFIYPPEISTGSITSILFMGIFQIGAASALFVYGVKRIRAVQAMLTAAVEPVLNPIWVLLVTGEKPAPSVITGGAVIIAAVIFSSLLGKRREEKF